MYADKNSLIVGKIEKVKFDHNIYANMLKILNYKKEMPN